MESLVTQHAGFDILRPPHSLLENTACYCFLHLRRRHWLHVWHALISNFLPPTLLYIYSMHSCHTADRCGPTDRYTLWFGRMWENIRHSDRKQYNMSDQWLFYSSPPYNNRQRGKERLNTRWQNRVRVHWSNLHDELYLLVMHYEWMWW